MSPIQSDSVSQPLPTPLLRLAFRPLFLGGALFAIFAIAWWTYYWIQPSAWMPYGGPLWWHSHEMLFGFVAAVVVGFLLTAVQTWTGVAGLKGGLLGVLVGIWVLGRLLLLVRVGEGLWLVAVIDVAFLVLAACAMAYPVLKVKQWRNLIFVPLLLLLAVMNGASHYAVIAGEPQWLIQSMRGAVMVVVVIVSVVGGRVIPLFTANATGCSKAEPLIWLERLSLISLLLMVAVAFIGFESLSPMVLAVLSLSAAVIQLMRSGRWGAIHSRRIPLLWSLHLSYACIALGFIGVALAAMGWISSYSAALHCFTVGAIGGMILAMIARVSLGHTGRPLQPPAMMTLAFYCLALAALVRVVLPGWVPALSVWGVGIAGVLWVLGYGLYCIYYARYLLTPRVDGRPG
ncbi:MAG: hypothetical protein CL693_07845 [Cellvibrionaceae bacterium]|nr:hypothetical protein [Cellvibrionaceae bacterium]|tara:strand:- start:4344 stop:5549 length:1206 start_codon:yes stop_codon:yes gene_type:complete